MTDNFKIIREYSKSSSREIAETILLKGLRKMRYLLNYFEGEDSDLAYICAPDFSMSLNSDRIRAGFSVGGILLWENHKNPFFPLDLMPNSCGMLLARISETITYEELLKRIKLLINDTIQIENLKMEIDLCHKNHFLNLYSDSKGVKYLIIHCSLPEAKKDNNIGCGVYYQVSDILKKQLKILPSPHGDIPFLEGNNADNFINILYKYDELSRKKREIIVSHLFSNYEIISNENHLTLKRNGVMLLGCNSPENDCILPLAVAPAKNAFLIKPKNRLIIHDQNLYVVPHGTGNKLLAMKNIEVDSNSNIISCKNGEQRFTVNDPKFLMDGYHDVNEVINSKLFEIVDELYPIMEFKI